MPFGHEQLDVYQVAIRYVSWAYAIARGLKGIDRHARDQLLRASQSIPLNIAEGNGKGTNADRRRFFEIARGSALECAAIQDCLASCQALTADQNTQGKAMLTRIVSMLTKLGQRNHEMREDFGVYSDFDYDNDNDNDIDNVKDNEA
ncbi:MAG: four helix bundle protein [Thiocapsa sp.]|uniref:four helix bundle protein n=1 Tax=Thiocapsa sp. TaxID=2024551 RepID=UPI001BCF9BC5|nr:four helix bundle protein [Thiocapsa sp.]QVL49256.1 MAG: four helix bundle protein [Thiocapsa sp.]